MKYTLILIFVVLATNTTIAQEASTALKLSKTLHAEKLESKIRFIQEVKKTNETQGDKIATDNLYKKVAEAYTKTFTQEEIANMYTFYNSALGKKLLENQRKLNRDVSTIVMQWEMEQQVIDPENNQTSRIVNGKRVETDSLRARKRKEMIAKRKAEREAPFPKINNLNDLKKLIEKQPYIVSDQRLLLELFGEEGVEKLRNPESRMLQQN